MALIPVRFEYLTGLRQSFLINARLTGNWNAQGVRSDQWSTAPMEAFTAEDGCPAFRATVNLDDSQIGQSFRWGVETDTLQQPNVWGVPTEVSDAAATGRYRSFTLRAADQSERYYLTHCRRLGANKLFIEGQAEPAIRFSVWAPNARNVELVRGEPAGGYIWNDGRGVTAAIPMHQVGEGIWATVVADAPALMDFAGFDHTPYMFRITREDGSIAYRTDLYSRCQIGSGGKYPDNPEPGEAPWDGTRQDVDGSKSCSVVIDPEQVVRPFRQVDANGAAVWPETDWLTVEEFWQDEFDANRPLPDRIDDLVIYELHIDGLGANQSPRGTLADAIALLDYLVDLGVNCVELMPTSEFEGWTSWGYGTSHYLAIEYAGGGRDQFKHFVRECHRRGIAVLLDVVYNHYTHDGERAQWDYDSTTPENNIYFWYEGRASDYPNANPPGHGGYIDNMSTGYAPRYWDEIVRKLFISSAAMLVSEFHLDGFRVDQTTSIHSYAVIHADGAAAQNARIFGAKFLREWTRTLRLLRPNLFLIAEDHSGWSAVTQSGGTGLGFDATWYADFYHHLIGDAQNDSSRARLLKFAGYGDNRELRMGWFAGALAESATAKVVYHESHDEAGNSYYIENGQEVHSARSIVTAVNGASLSNAATRRYAEARVHVVAGMTLLGPGIPMFFMGEEVGASEPYRYDDFINHRENFPALRQGAGANLFRFYQELIRLRQAHPALRSRNIDVLYVHDANRILAFRRWEGGEELLVIASLNNGAFGDGYRIQNSRIADGQWREVFNSDAQDYGGGGLLNAGSVASAGGVFSARLPANSVLAFQRQ